MTKTEIKKALYRQKPKAHLEFIRKSIAYYHADLKETRVFFNIPVDDMGSASFAPIMQGQLLIRWLVEIEEGININKLNVAQLFTGLPE